MIVGVDCNRRPSVRLGVKRGDDDNEMLHIRKPAMMRDYDERIKTQQEKETKRMPMQ